jgi:VRR-NUC domain
MLGEVLGSLSGRPADAPNRALPGAGGRPARQSRRLTAALNRLERAAPRVLPLRGAPLERIQESEDGFLGWVRDLAGWRRWRTYHTLRSKGSEAGFPDLVLVRPPRLIFAELKIARARGGRLSRAQREWLADLLEVEPALEVYIWRPDDRPVIERILR